jgi:AcrR family transcriptional regulator
MSGSKEGSSGSSEQGNDRPPGRGDGKPAAKGSGKSAAQGRAQSPAKGRGKSAAKASGKPPKGSRKPRGKTTQEIVPIYARLPKGPHRIGAPGVAHNQRIRIHGGMIEAVTARGYKKASVRLVIGLAGVSRRSFYEQFSGKEACFVETFDLIVNRAIKRLTDAYQTAEGVPQRRMRMVFEAFGSELEQNPKALRLVMSDAQTAGPEGRRRLQRTAAVCEGLLAGAFSDRRYPDALPLPVVRAILGGLRRATCVRLRDDETEDLESLMKEMLKWSLVFKSPAVRELRPRPCANQPFPEALELEPDACGGDSRRAMLLRSVIAASAREPKFEDLSSLHIADEAQLPIETFMELYRNPDACYLDALDVLGDEMLQLIADPDLVSAEWSAAVCRAVARLLEYLADSPARLVTLAGKALEAGPEAIANVGDLAYEVATLLTEGAPRRPRTRIAVEGIAGALWHILHCEVLAGRGHRLPMLSEYLSYVVLTPFLGPEAAAQAIVESRISGPGPTESPPRPPVDGRFPANGASNGAGARNGSAPAAEDYRRLAERRSAKCVNTTPTSTESTITTIKGA